VSSDAPAGSITVTLHFDPELDFFLSPEMRGRPQKVTSGHATTIKDIVESCGVPHTEIGDLIVGDTLHAGFSTRISDGDCIRVLSVTSAAKGKCGLQPLPSEPIRFAADIHLGKLARRLRLLGFDTAWFIGKEDSELLDIMERDGRILLTRDRRLLMNNRVVHGCCIRSDHVLEQARQVVDRYGLAASARPFSRCPACNGLLESCRKESVAESLPPKTRRYYETFRVCSSCGKIYWEGAHMARLREFVSEVLGR
jgi:uncharacterized protein with PIN domain